MNIEIFTKGEKDFVEQNTIDTRKKDQKTGFYTSDENERPNGLREFRRKWRAAARASTSFRDERMKWKESVHFSLRDYKEKK